MLILFPLILLESLFVLVLVLAGSLSDFAKDFFLVDDLSVEEEGLRVLLDAGLYFSLAVKLPDLTGIGGYFGREQSQYLELISRTDCGVVQHLQLF